MRRFILSFGQVYCKISLVTIRDVVFDNKNIESTILNPIFGYLFEVTGCLSNLRFYSPLINPVYENEKRIYAKDKSFDPFVQNVITLFPSPTGTLNNVYNIYASFTTIFNNDRTDSITFLSDLFVSVITNRKPEYTHKSKTKRNIFNELKERMFCESNINMFKDRNLKLLLIHAIAINVLETKKELEEYLMKIMLEIDIKNLKKYSLENENEINSYIGVFKRGIEWIFPARSLFWPFNSNQTSLSDNITRVVVEVQKVITNFPYSNINLPVSNDRIPCYNREDDNFHEQCLFSDCGDILLLHLCNCLFYDPVTCEYNLKHLQLPENCSLLRFYEKHKKLFSVTRDIRMDWAKVVEGLEAFEEIDKNTHNTHLIMYVQNNKNEIKSGILNMMCVLTKICKISARNEIFDGLTSENILSKIQTLFDMLVRSDVIVKVGCVKEEPREFSSIGRIDFVGEFDVEFYYRNNENATVSIKHSESHSTFSFICKTTDVNTKKIENYINLLEKCNEKAELPIILLKRYFCLINATESSTDDMFSTFYISGNISSNSQKLFLLKSSYGFINDLEEKDPNTVEHLKSISERLLRSVNLNDITIHNRFKPFMLYIPGIDSERKFNEYWSSAFSLSDQKVAQLWCIEAVKRQIRKIEIKKCLLDQCEVEMILKVAEKLKNRLEFFIVKGARFTFEISKGFASFFETATSLKTVDISFNMITSCFIGIIATSLKNMKKLKKFSISVNSLNTKDFIKIIEVLSTLEAFEELDVSSNLIEVSKTTSGEVINALLRIKKKWVLNLSGNEVQDSVKPEIEKKLPNITFIF